MQTRYTPRVTPMRKARKQSHRTIQDMARELKVSPETYRRWEQGQQICRWPSKVAKALGISPDAVIEMTTRRVT